MNKIIKTKKDRIVNIVLTILYVLINIVLISYHEAWRDEAQAWLIAKNNDLEFIFSNLSNEGHPFLWFLVLRFFAQLGLRFEHISYISLTVMTSAVIVFLEKSGFKTMYKITIVLCPIFFYYNSVISRNYCILVFLIVLLSSFWEIRKDKPFLYGIITALICQTHVLLSGVAIGLIIDMFISLIRDNKRRNSLISLLISGLSLVLMIFELWQRNGTKTFIHVSINSILNAISFQNILRKMYSIFNKYFFFKNEFLTIISSCLLALLVLSLTILLFSSFIKNKQYRELIVFSIALIIYCSIICFVRRSEHIQMSICLLLIYFFVIWINYKNYAKNGKRIFVLFYIVLLIVCINGIYDSIYDVKNNFSNSKESAKYIAKYLPNNSVLLVCEDDYLVSTIAYLYDFRSDIIIWDVTKNKRFSNVTWEEIQRTLKIDELNNIANNFYNNSVYYLSSIDLPYEMVYSNTKNNKWNEVQYLYIIN